MQYIKNADYEYVINKYHDSTQPFNSFNRFIRRDEIFFEQTGMHGENIKEGVVLQDEKLKTLPHSIRKAKAVEFVLNNTRIACDNRDRFPAINAIDRPLNHTLIANWKYEVFYEIIPEVGRMRDKYLKDGISNMNPDYDHSVPFWERVFALGFNGLLQESEKARLSRAISEEQDAFYEGIKITYEAIINFIGRLADMANATKGSKRLADALSNIQYNPPKTFYEALLVDYLYFMISEHIEGLQVRSLGNLDKLLYKFYKNDLENGVTEQQIREDIAYFYLQFTAIGNYWNQPMFFGGCKEDEQTEINELSYLLLDVYDKMGIFNPKLQIKVADSTPKEFLLKALDMIRRGNSSIVFVGEKTIREALIKKGVSKNEARLCDVKGCYEYSPRGSLGTGMVYVNLIKPLEYALHCGCDAVTKEMVSIKSPEVSEYKTFEEFYTEYKRQLKHVIDCTMKTVDAYEDYLVYMNPQSMLSATYPSCVELARDALGGGAFTNSTSMSIGFLADLVDSLTAIKKHVFDGKKLTLKEFVEILDNNYVGHEKFRQQLLNDTDKFGNDKDLPDSFAKDITQFICQNVNGKPNAKKRGGTWASSYHVARMSYIQGELTGATPNGRLKGEELSKNASASMGQNKAGPTAAILSTTKIDATAVQGDVCLDLGLLPSTVKGQDGLQAMYGLLQTFIKRGGQALQFNVLDAETLKDAQKHPEKYQDLQIRVAGWNVLWNNINKVEQDGFIKQAESLI